MSFISIHTESSSRHFCRHRALLAVNFPESLYPTAFLQKQQWRRLQYTTIQRTWVFWKTRTVWRKYKAILFYSEVWNLRRKLNFSSCKNWHACIWQSNLQYTVCVTWIEPMTSALQTQCNIISNPFPMGKPIGLHESQSISIRNFTDILSNQIHPARHNG